MIATNHDFRLWHTAEMRREGLNLPLSYPIADVSEAAAGDQLMTHICRTGGPAKSSAFAKKNRTFAVCPQFLRCNGTLTQSLPL